ncbi:hypothetical protein CUJ83_05785 [Methanocella sp. CWC-04]|uniref:KEOPS complex subunit Cgi121 n=1 Tax=Methanooceanicella nereidis TaxID=2052831 RepID=A0AAP2W4N5_9EURY|nr:KEOPS complex subunit Cgi121 [Methanocella sp. CWC-04]MCD1294510.1 hypothetical protein [Methanocella sp. CWC-04]
MTDVLITGGKANISDVRSFLKSLAEIGKKYGIIVQAVNADRVAGRPHMEFSVIKAVESFKNNRNLARDMGMEVMLYLRGRRQIEKALEMGVKEGGNNIAIAIIGEGAEKALQEVQARLDVVDESVVDYTHDKDETLMKLFEITPAELEIVGKERIPELVKERSALLEFEK